MEKRYLDLGGKIRKGVSVEKVIVEDNKAKGVLLKKGETLYSDWVVSTVPVEHCLKDLLENKFSEKKFDFRLADEKTYPIYTFTTAVIKCPKTIKDNTLTIKKYLDTPVIMDREYNHVALRNYSYDETVKGADGYTIIQATIHSDDKMYYWWQERKDNGSYKQEKARMGEILLEIAKSVHPDIADQMQLIDVVTPCTYTRYLNSRHGSFQGFVHTKKGKSLMQNGRIKGLKNFILSGQCIIQSGGLPAAGMSGRFTAQRICHTDKKKFKDF
jgi:phytoene dehydrogenase-like protein